MNKILYSHIFSKTRNRFFLLTLFLVLIFTTVGFITYGYILTGIDDANITFVYSKNIANGHGFVYNIGGEHVEGSSTMLWTLIVAVLYKIFTYPNLAILTLNIAVITFGIGYLANTIWKTFQNRSKSLVALGIFFAWIFAIPTYIVWSTLPLMEFGLYSSILLVVLSLLIKNSQQNLSNIQKYLFYTLISALTLIRPEGLFWNSLFILLYFLTSFFKNKSFKSTFKLSIWPALSFIITAILLVGFRLSYFGYPFPNTYYAKVSVDFLYNLKQGYYYLLSFINSNLAAFFLVILSVVIVGSLFLKIVYSIKNKLPLKVLEFQLFVISLVIIAGLLIPVLNGGDQFPQFRFIQPIWPILILPVIYIINLIDFSFVKVKSGKAYLVGSLVLGAFFVFYNVNNINWHKYKEQELLTLRPQFQLAYDDQQNGKDYNEFFAPLEKLPNLGVVAAGAIKLTYNGDVNDLLGLNNVEMAHANPIKVGVKNHAAFEKEVFYAQQPEVMNLAFVKGFTIGSDEYAYSLRNYWNSVLKGIYDDGKFKELYSEAVVYKKDSNKYLFGVFKKDFLEKLKSYEIYEVSLRS